MERTCCICENEHANLYKTVKQGKTNYNLLKCNGCELVYLDSNSVKEKRDFIKDAQRDIDKNGEQKVEYWSFPNYFEKYGEVFTKFFDERFKRIKKHNKNIKNMLDVGSGYGFWMRYCEDKGIKTQGLDISESVVDYATNNLGLEVKLSDALSYESDKKYDSIIMFDVLEHMEEPNTFLKKYREMLSENGQLYIQVPNLIGFHIPKDLGYGLPHHFWQFGPKTLTKLLKKNNFNVVDKWTGPIGVIATYEKGENMFWNKLKWKISRKLSLGPRLQVMARKNEK